MDITNRNEAAFQVSFIVPCSLSPWFVLPPAAVLGFRSFLNLIHCIICI